MKIIINGWKVNIPWQFMLESGPFNPEPPYFSWKDTIKDGVKLRKDINKRGEQKEVTILLYVATGKTYDIIKGPYLLSEFTSPEANDARYFLNLAKWQDVLTIGVLAP